jgi:outer membrane protein TolC
VSAQTPESTGGAGVSSGSSLNQSLSAQPSGAPFASSSGGIFVAQRPLTLEDVVEWAINTNSTVRLAKQRLQQAQEQIAQVDAQGRPQSHIEMMDTYTNYLTSAVGISNNPIQNPTLPGGGQIPQVIDQAGSSATSYVGAGGGTSSGSAPYGAGLPPPVSAASSPGNNNSPTESKINSVGSAKKTTSDSGGEKNSGNGLRVGEAIAGLAIASLPSIVQNYATAENNVDQYALPEGDEAPAISKSESAQPGHARSAQAGDSRDALAPNAEASTGDGSSAGTTSSHNNIGSRIAVSQYVDVFGLLGASRNVETITRDFYGLDVERLQNEIAMSAKNLFFNVLYAQAQVDVQKEQLSYATENARVISSRYDNKVASQFDLLTAQTLLANTQQALSIATGQLQIAQSNLAYLLGTDPKSDIALVPPPLPSLDQTLDVDQSVRMANARRPELRQAENNVVIAKKLIKLASAPLKPTVGIIGSAGYHDVTTSDGTQETYAISAQLNIPLDDGGTTRAQVRAAKVAEQTQQTTRDQLQSAVALEVRQAVINVGNAQAQVRTAIHSADLAHEALRLATTRVQSGVGTQLDVTNALSQLALAQTNLANAQFQYQTSLAQYLRAIGGR